MTDIGEFSPCPFCGGSDLKLVHLSTGIRCNGCGMESVLAPGTYLGRKDDRMAQLVSRWNRRA